MSSIRRRLVAGAVAVIAVLVASFSLVRLIPGDPVARVAGPNVTPAQLERIRHELGLDVSFWQQLATYLRGVFTGDLGTSFSSHEPVATIIAARLPQTLELAGTAFLLAVGIGIPLGLLMGALTRDGRRHRLMAVFTGATSLVHAVPDYLMAALLVLVFAVSLRVLPVAGADEAASLVLPSVAVAAGAAAVLARVTRAETVTVLSLDYVRAAHAKNLSTARVYGRHVLPNVVTAALTISGLMLTSLVGGTVVVENVFAWPGLGTELVRAISQRDYPVVQAVVLLLGVTIVVVNALVDLTIAALDPRSTAQGG
jgi:peptide/nickel transport system permease protein